MSQVSTFVEDCMLCVKYCKYYHILEYLFNFWDLSSYQSSEIFTYLIVRTCVQIISERVSNLRMTFHLFIKDIIIIALDYKTSNIF